MPKSRHKFQKNQYRKIVMNLLNLVMFCDLYLAERSVGEKKKFEYKRLAIKEVPVFIRSEELYLRRFSINNVLHIVGKTNV